MPLILDLAITTELMQPSGGVERGTTHEAPQRRTQNTHSHDAFVHVQVIRTLPAQMFHSPREHAWLKGQHGSGLRIVVYPKRFRHPSVMSHMLPHLSLNTSARSLSPTSPIFRPSSPSLSCPLELDQETLRDSRRSGGSTKSSSPTNGIRCSHCSDSYARTPQERPTTPDQVTEHVHEP